MNIGLLIIATNKYIEFLQALITSADNFFLKNHNVTYFIFTNKDIDINSNRSIIKLEIEHKEWPWMTLGRYKIFLENSKYLKKMDYLYYIDVDMLIVGNVGDEILGKLVATQHPGFCGKRGTPENRIQSLAYIPPHIEMQYFAGGFNGGSSKEFLKMSKILNNNIDIDYKNNIIAIWHDESHLNRYLVDNEPSVILSPNYCHPEYDKKSENTKIIALVKEHEKYR